MYDPGLGRFLQRDPFAGIMGAPLTLNRFTYVENNPLGAVDPSGLASAQATSAVLRKLTSWMDEQRDKAHCELPEGTLWCFLPKSGPFGFLNLLPTKFVPPPGGDDAARSGAKLTTTSSSGSSAGGKSARRLWEITAENTSARKVHPNTATRVSRSHGNTPHQIKVSLQY